MLAPKAAGSLLESRWRNDGPKKSLDWPVRWVEM
ncbi:unnamed protein product [Protopolystoma xenopodis]|uniref:Uncharacterized protein n=1 Tax=Protopolystoma xenopodis TaxID=117903 RepID=A0A448XPN8_9PLAT|nr:unnamed protein product [Protopolystoma xenopodis]